MRIGLVIEQFDPQRGGAEQWTFQFTHELLARGHEVHVVAQKFAPIASSLPITAHRLEKTRTRLGFAAAAERRLRSLALDVVHDMGAGWCCDVFESHDGSRFAQWERKLLALPPWVRPVKRMLIRVLPRYGSFRKLCRRQFADPQRIVLALSQMVAHDYRHYHGVRPEQIRLVYNGVDTRRFSPAHRPRHRRTVRGELGVCHDEVLLLFVGHDFHRKGLGTALRAMGRLVREAAPVRLAVVGGKHFGRFVRLARRAGVAAAVRFLGSIGDPVPYYAAADVYVLPTLYDPCSLGVLEAAASGLPSVTTRFNGAGELLTDGVDGYLLNDPTDDAALADRLRVLLDPTRREQMGESARQTALRHTLEENCEKILAIYREVAGVRARAA